MVDIALSYDKAVTYVSDKINGATAEMKPAWEKVKANLKDMYQTDKHLVIKDGKLDLSDLKKTLGEDVKVLADKGEAIWDDTAPGIGDFFTKNKSALVGFGILAVLGGMFDMGFLGVLMAVVGGVIFGAMGDKGGMFGGLVSGFKDMMGIKEPHHDISHAIQIPTAGLTQEQQTALEKLPVKDKERAKSDYEKSGEFSLVSQDEKHNVVLNLTRNLEPLGGKGTQILTVTGTLNGDDLTVTSVKDATGKDLPQEKDYLGVIHHLAKDGKITADTLKPVNTDLRAQREEWQKNNGLLASLERDEKGHMTDAGAKAVVDGQIALLKQTSISLEDQKDNNVTLRVNLPGTPEFKDAKFSSMLLKGTVGNDGSLIITNIYTPDGKEIPSPNGPGMKFEHKNGNLVPVQGLDPSFKGVMITDIADKDKKINIEQLNKDFGSVIDQMMAAPEMAKNRADTALAIKTIFNDAKDKADQVAAQAKADQEKAKAAAKPAAAASAAPKDDKKDDKEEKPQVSLNLGRAPAGITGVTGAEILGNGTAPGNLMVATASAFVPGVKLGNLGQALKSLDLQHTNDGAKTASHTGVIDSSNLGVA